MQMIYSETMSFASISFIYKISKLLKSFGLESLSYEIASNLSGYFGFSSSAIIIKKGNRQQRIVSCIGKKESIMNAIKTFSDTLKDKTMITVKQHEAQKYGFSGSLTIFSIQTDRSTGYIIIEKTVPLNKEESITIKTLIKLIEFRLAIEERGNLTSISEKPISYQLTGQEFPEIIGKSNKIKQIFDIISAVAGSNSSVMIYGKSGTGKELIAKAIHYSSNRKNKKFVAINCAAIPEALFESELFGFEKGSFTGASGQKKGLVEIADKGTLFFDEIAEMPLSMQPKLLRLIQEKTITRIGGTRTIPVDFRLICATNKNLDEMVKSGEFREDLYYRINVIPINVPTLSERREDIPLLVEHFRRLFCNANNKSVRFSAEAIETLMKYPWPGNVRELENIIERLIVMAPPLSSTIKNIDLSEIIPSIEQSDTSLKQIEKTAILDALNASGGNKEQAARLLDITLRQLNYKMEKHKIDTSCFNS